MCQPVRQSHCVPTIEDVSIVYHKINVYVKVIISRQRFGTIEDVPIVYHKINVYVKVIISRAALRQLAQKDFLASSASTAVY